MNRAIRLVLPLLAASALACAPPGAGSDADASATPDDTPALRIAGETLTVATIDERLMQDLLARATGGDALKLWTQRRDTAERIIDERLLDAEATSQGTTAQELLEREARKRASVSDEDVQGFYDAHKDRIGREFEEVRDQIRMHLDRESLTRAKREYLQSLREGKDIAVLLAPPRTEVAGDGPARGPDDAPVTIIEFSDYQCPYCRRVEPTVEQVIEAYGDRVRFVYRHFPIDSIHPLARAASEAAACADEQGGFWPFHERLFADGAELDAKSLETHASEAGLDLEAFKTCVAERRFQEQVSADIAAGQAAGVTGTPAFFVNGIRLSGARPFEDFQKLIDEELAGASS